MNIYDYPKELNEALKYKREEKTFEQYEAAAQRHLQPIECQIFWLLAEDVMDIVAEEVNKETAELVKQLGEKDAKLTRQKEMLNKLYGSLAGNPDGSPIVEGALNGIGHVIYKVEGDDKEYEAFAFKYDDDSRALNGRGLDITIQKNQTLGNWFIITDLDTGSRRAHRLKDIVSWTELRYPMVTETSPIPEDPD